MNLITPAIDAFLACGALAVLVGLVVIKVRAKNRRMKIAPSPNVHYAAIIRQASGAEMPRAAGNSQRQKPGRKTKSGFAQRNGIDGVAQKKEKIMERETIENGVAANLNHQDAGFSSGNLSEATALLQEALPAAQAEEILPPSMLTAAVAKESAGTPVEIHIMDTEVRAPQEMASLPESTQREESMPEVGMCSAIAEQEQARAEVSSTAICLWEGERVLGGGLNEDEIDVDALYTAEEIPALPEVRNYLELEAEAEATGNFERMEQFDIADLEKDPAPVAVVEAKLTGPTLLSFHGLKQQPFDVTPDPAYLYFSPSHREALESISEGIENFRGFMTLVAEPGMGKTTLLNKLMEEWSASARVVFLFQTQCNSSELLAFILNELEVDHTGMDVVAMHRALNQVLLEEMLRGRRFVLIVDEGQNLQDSVLETIRLLSDFETAHSKLIQIVLAGQPQMVDTLLRPSLVQLRQRIAVLSNLKSLTAEETSAYVEHRLRAAGWKGDALFTPEAVQSIAELSGGVPRTINNLCFNSLLKAFTRREQIVSAEIVKEISGKLHLEALARPVEKVAVPEAPAPKAPVENVSTAEIIRALTAVVSAVAARPIPQAPRPAPEQAAAPVAAPAAETKPGLMLTGKLIEKIKCQGWSKKLEYRLDVSFERDPLTGVGVAERHYCCYFYVGEAEAVGLQVGKPIRVRIEQE